MEEREVALLEQQLDKLRQEHVTVAGYPVDGELVAIRKPSHGEYARYVDRVAGGKGSVTLAMKELALACLIRPEQHEDKRALLEKWPGLITTLSSRAVELANSEVKELGKD